MTEHKCGKLRLRHISEPDKDGYTKITATCDECHKVVTFEHCFPFGVFEFTVDTGKNSLVEPATFEFEHTFLAEDEVVCLGGAAIPFMPVPALTKVQVIDLSVVETLMKWKNRVMNPPKEIEVIPPVLGIVEKVWGTEEIIANESTHCGKIMRIKPGWMCSYHMHEEKDETFYVQNGPMLMEVEDTRKVAYIGESFRIPPGTWHRFATLDCKAQLFEFSSHHDDADVLRRAPSGPISEEMKQFMQDFYDGGWRKDGGDDS